jgi:hypothetical protein
MKKPKLRSSHAKPINKRQPDALSMKRKRIEKMLAVWEKFPDRSFVQLLTDACGQKTMPYMTDESLVQHLIEYGKLATGPSESIPNERVLIAEPF